MNSPILRPSSVLVAFLTLTGPALAQDIRSETFSFPQSHDTPFGANRFLGDFNWFADGHGVRGRRVSTQEIAGVEAFGFNLFLGLTCIANLQPVFLDAYVNDRLVGSAPLPDNILCNSVPTAPIQGQFAIDPPIAGLGTGTEYEIRLQLRGNASPIPKLFVFYGIDTSSSTIAIAGRPTPPPPPPPPPPLPPPPDLSHTDIVNQVQQSESNIVTDVRAGADRLSNQQNAALAAVKDALGVVEGNVNATIAGAVLKVNAETAAGVDRLASQLGIQGQDLALAIKGNTTAIANVQKGIEEKLLPEILKTNQNVLLTSDAVRDVGNNFLDKMLGQALSIGGRIIDFYAGGGIVQVANFVKRSIDQVINGNLRPDRVVKRAIAEFNRGLRRLRRIFRSSATLQAAGDTAEFAALMAADLPGGDETGLEPDIEEEDVFGAYLWFERAYQTLVKGQPKNGPVK